MSAADLKTKTYDEQDLVRKAKQTELVPSELENDRSEKQGELYPLSPEEQRGLAESFLSSFWVFSSRSL